MRFKKKGEQSQGRKVASLEASIHAYLTTLSKTVPSATFYTHQTALSSFLIWIQENNICRSTTNEELIAQYTIYFIEEYNPSTDTISGYINSLTNFFGVVTQEDPELMKIRVTKHFQGKSGSDLKKIKAHICRRFLDNSGPSGATEEDIESLISYLRQRRFGSRTHAHVEILYDTKSRLEPIHQLNLENINLENGTAEIGIPETQLVSSIGLVTERTAELSSTTIDALQVYIDHERKDSMQEKPSPFFTTSHGRASRSTLCRSTKKASEEAATHFGPQNNDERVTAKAPVAEKQSKAVVPSDIWWHTVSKILY